MASISRSDLERYRKADTKIGRVTEPITLDHNNEGRTRYWARMRGTPPAPDTNLVKLDPWRSLTFTGAPRQPARLILDFTGRFHCVDTDAGCQHSHSYEMTFRRPFRWISASPSAGRCRHAERRNHRPKPRR